MKNSHQRWFSLSVIKIEATVSQIVKMTTLNSCYESCWHLFDQNYSTLFFIHKSSLLVNEIRNFWSDFHVLLTNISHFESLEFFHVTFFMTRCFVYFRRCLLLVFSKLGCKKANLLKNDRLSFRASDAVTSSSFFKVSKQHRYLV